MDKIMLIGQDGIPVAITDKPLMTTLNEAGCRLLGLPMDAVGSKIDLREIIKASGDAQIRVRKSGAKNLLTNKQRSVMLHALGLDNGERIYRNYFEATGEDVAVWEQLVALGFAAERDPGGVYRSFVVTDAGMDALGPGIKARVPQEERYPPPVEP